MTLVSVCRGGPSWLLGLLPRARAIQEECNHGSVKKLTEGPPTGGSAVNFERHSFFWRTFFDLVFWCAACTPPVTRRFAVGLGWAASADLSAEAATSAEPPHGRFVDAAVASGYLTGRKR